MTRSLSTSRVPRRERGIGMVEVLIAVLIISIGFLGMAALQAKALSTNNSAMARSMATVASYSILDAMRSDLTNADAGSYNQTVYANNCAAFPPTGSGLADTQLNNWCNSLGDALGAVATTSGQIVCSNTGICTITIQFDDSRAGVGGVANQKVLTVAGL